jgi:hypothetical protein
MECATQAGEADAHHVLRMLDYFYWKEHLIIVSEVGS